MRQLTRGIDSDELLATVALLRADAAPFAKLSALLDYVGSAVDLLPQQFGGAGLPGLPFLFEAIDQRLFDRVEAEVGEWRDAGYDLRCLSDSRYPTNLRAVFNKPALLFFDGVWDAEADARGVSIVGTRRASEEGRKRAFRLAKSLAERGFTVFSGLAAGIDTAAHQGALKAGGRTVAVMGTGIDRRYPRENAGLAEHIRQRGCLVTQFFPGHPPTRWAFPLRNVTMSGLSLATIVVEAGATSGAKMQAEAALVHGRTVFLPQSLLASHAWARTMVEAGHRGARAIAVGSPEEVVDLLAPRSPEALVA